jgi:hypothetical protein
LRDGRAFELERREEQNGCRLGHGGAEDKVSTP